MIPKKLKIGLFLTIGLIVLGAAGFGIFKFVNSTAYTYIDSKIKSEKTVDTTYWEGKSAGINFGVYQFEDKFGRECTAIVSRKAPGLRNLDCDYVPEHVTDSRSEIK